ncbi:EF hand family protein [Tritrichomonas foetus]|uniref:EF hand family protein n=1 Tax=Tritrichomonas foetus TaxID=1144522 RepID=A0A1J4JCQ2_9EUKA|nr:EF hand family protein [Tritrichomonas foetus]|eukprot:OHS95060.1 EF hand family protein [Tritrichomonas foetus]
MQRDLSHITKRLPSLNENDNAQVGKVSQNQQVYNTQKTSNDSKGNIKFEDTSFSSIKSDKNGFVNPPRSMKSRIGQRQKQRENTQQRRFISQLRHAFEEVDISNDGFIDVEQWNNSKLREIIHDGNLSDSEFIDYFRRIDANNNEVITWSELVHYLMKDISSVDFVKSNDAVQFIDKSMASPVHTKSQMHRESVKSITQCLNTGEYITLSDDSIRFWNPADLSFKRHILDPGNFSACVVFENTLTLAVATTSRRLIFFNLDTLALLPIEISASPSPKTIHKMTLNDARNALKILESPQMPMFNSPSTMAIMSSGSPVIATTVPPPINSMTTPTVSSATASISKGSSLTHKSITNKKPKKEAETKKSDGFFVGDDQGIIEAFKLVAPLRRQGTDFTIDRVGRCQVHNGLISQIIPIDSFETYASASHDNTIKLWKYDIYTKSFTIVRVFQDDQPVLSIIFSSHQKVIASCSSARDAFVWSLSPPRKIFKLGSHYNQLQLITDYITTTNERYILTMTNKKEFRLWDSVNYRMVREWSDPSCPEWKYTAAFFDERRHVLIAAHRDIIKWAEDESALLESKEAHTHRRPIVGCFLSNAFGQIVTIDSVCSIRVWNVETGTMASSHNEPRAYGNSDICTATLDCSGRRLLTSDFKNNVLMRNYNSGSELATLNLPHTSSLITILNSCTIGGRDYLIRAGWDKTIALFCEAEQYHYELHRMFSGHSTDISAVAGFNIGVISGTINGEIFSWTFDSHIPIAAKELVSHATVEFLIIINDKYLVVGDSACTMSLFSLPKLLPITSFEFSHGIYSPCSLSAAVCERVESSNKSDMCYILYTADTLGYVQTWKIMIGSLDNDIKISKLNDISRLSNDEINKLIVYNDFFIVCCVDSCVRVFTKEDFAYIGFFSDESSWSLDDESTWVYTCIDIDKKHFKEPLNGERSHVMAARSLRIMPQFSERFFHE